MKEKDMEYMRQAIELAKKGEGWTAPNPMVGAVIVKDGIIIGEGYHARCGELHAERNALAAVRESAGSRAEELLCGATMYVTLEPCCHYGKTPPCTEAILAAKIGRVVVGSRDPNPLVAGKGIAVLREAEVAVEEDFLREECDRLNPIFFHYITTGLPYVAMKYAMTADGKIATVSGKSKWITGEAARKHVQQLRRRYTGIMVGINTVFRDDPLLTCRIVGVKNPIRIICDSNLRIPLDSQICKTAAEIPTIVAVRRESEEELERIQREAQDRKNDAAVLAGVRIEQKKKMAPLLRKKGIQIMEIPSSPTGTGIDPQQLMKRLGEGGIDSILLEGGGTLNYSMLSAGLVNRVYAYIAPKIFGGAGAKTPVDGEGAELPSQAFFMGKPEVQFFGDDILLEYEVKKTGNRGNGGRK